MHPADDKRALFIRVVDDIVDQIRTGKLQPDDVLPTARKMADIYDIASMTAQRAMRELQTMGLTYGITGKGTFVHPEAPRRINVNIDGKPDPEEGDLDPEMSPDLAVHLQYRDTLVELTLKLISTRDKQEQAHIRAQLGLMQAIYDGQARELKEEIAAYQARLAYAAAKASPPADTTEQPAADEPPKPARKRSPKK